MKERGSTIPEMAIVVGVGLMLFFGAVRLALVGYYQIMSDGAAFVAARSYAQNPSAGQSNAQTAALKIFPRVAPSNLTMAVGTNTVSASVTQQTAGLMIPGAAQNVSVTGTMVERVGTSAPAPQNTPYPFAVSATLANYYTAAGVANPNYSIAISDGDDFGNGNGANGRFGEWKCRAGVYGGIFPSTRPKSGGPNSSWDPQSSASGTLHQIYSWDGGATCL